MAWGVGVAEGPGAGGEALGAAGVGRGAVRGDAGGGRCWGTRGLGRRRGLPEGKPWGPVPWGWGQPQWRGCCFVSPLSAAGGTAKVARWVLSSVQEPRPAPPPPHVLFPGGPCSGGRCDAV